MTKPIRYQSTKSNNELVNALKIELQNGAHDRMMDEYRVRFDRAKISYTKLRDTILRKMQIVNSTKGRGNETVYMNLMEFADSLYEVGNGDYLDTMTDDYYKYMQLLNRLSANEVNGHGYVGGYVDNGEFVVLRESDYDSLIEDLIKLSQQLDTLYDLSVEIKAIQIDGRNVFSNFDKWNKKDKLAVFRLFTE